MTWLGLTWDIFAFLCSFLIVMPVYFWILKTIITERRKKNDNFMSPFYALTICQRSADFLSLLAQFLFLNGRKFDFTKSFFWESRDTYMATIQYAQVYLGLSVRIIGVFMISFQRYLSVCYSFSKLNMIFSKTPCYTFAFLQYLSSILICIPILTEKVTLDSELTMNTLIPDDLLLRNCAMAGIGCMTILFFTLFFYAQTFQTLLWAQKNLTTKNGNSFRQEMNMTIQISGLIVVFAMITAHYFATYICVLTKQDNSYVFILRQFYPLWSALLSYINPLMILIINGDVRNRLFSMNQSNRSSVTVKVAVLSKYSSHN